MESSELQGTPLLTVPSTYSRHFSGESWVLNSVVEPCLTSTCGGTGLKKKKKKGIEKFGDTHTFNPITWEAEADGSLSLRPSWSTEQVLGHPGYTVKPVLKKTKSLAWLFRSEHTRLLCHSFPVFCFPLASIECVGTPFLEPSAWQPLDISRGLPEEIFTFSVTC